MDASDLKTIARRVPSLVGTLRAIELLAGVVGSLTVYPFLEPVSLVVEEGDKKRLLAVGAPDLRCWCLHMAFSTRARLRSTESAIVHEIAQGRLLPAAVLLS